jgi:hypothetical protein
MKRKIFTSACTFVLIALLSVLNVSDGILKGKDGESIYAGKSSFSGASFSEIRLSPDELINKSGLIVRCIFSGKKETKIVSSLTTNGKGEETGFEAPVTTYKMKTVDCLKGSVNKQFVFGLIGTGDRNFEKNGEYVMFLNYNSHNKTYTLVSYSQGLTKVKKKDNGSAKSLSDLKDEEIEILSQAGELTELKQLKEKIKELEK